MIVDRETYFDLSTILSKKNKLFQSQLLNPQVVFHGGLSMFQAHLP